MSSGHLFGSRRPNVIALSYVAAVTVCAALAFRSGDLLNLQWVLIVIGLTLPWSLLTFLGMWAMIHDNTHHFAMAVHIGWGILNAYCALAIARRWRRRVLPAPTPDASSVGDR